MNYDLYPITLRGTQTLLFALALVAPCAAFPFSKLNLFAAGLLTNLW